LVIVLACLPHACLRTGLSHAQCTENKTDGIASVPLALLSTLSCN
jgi:hypothetical protein